MNIAQNVSFFAKDIFSILQDTLYQLILIHFVTFYCGKIMKKPTLCLCERDRCGPACASTQSDLRLSCSLLDMALFIYSGLNVLVK